MESVWDYIMRRKPVFLGYFALFLVSVFASCSLLSSLLPHEIPSEPHPVQKNPQTIQYNDSVLLPQAVANLSLEAGTKDISISGPTQSSLIYVELADPNPGLNLDLPTQSENPTGQPLEPNNVPNEGAQQTVATGQTVDVPLTSAPETTLQSPRRVSIFRTILAVLLSVTALTLAGFGLYQAYGYFRPTFEKYLRKREK